MSGRLIAVDTSSLSNPQFDEEEPTVCVLMSTYNGARYVEEQIRSIANQIGAKVSLRMRDDGSTDNTVDVAEYVLSVTGLQHEIKAGINTGFLCSFEELLLQASGCDYYAFSDQDDVWGVEKLSRAIAALKSAEDKPAIYASSVVIADEMLNPVARNAFPNFRYSLSSELVRHRLAGHTMVWNEALQAKLREYGNIAVWSHDQHVVVVGLALGADLFLDSTSYVLHRRLPESITPGGGSFGKRLRHETKMMLNESGQFTRRALALDLLGLEGVSFSEEEISLLRTIAYGCDSVIENLRFAISPSIRCGLLLGDIEARISILLGRFS